MYNIIVFLGPSGSGKSTLQKHLGFEKITTWTSRKKRPSEKDGYDYHFTTRDNLKEMFGRNLLLEYTEYSNNYYGTSIKSIQDTIDSNKIKSIVLDVNGTKKLKSIFPESTLIIGVIAPLEDCMDNLILRKDTNHNERISTYENEINRVIEMSDMIINNHKGNWENSNKIIELIKLGLLQSF